MTREFCDICGKEINDWSCASRFKIKRRVYSWHESWWERLSVHNNCWIDLINIVKKNSINKEPERSVNNDSSNY